MIRSETLRQLLIATGLTMCSISDGFIFGQMSGMIDALGTKDTTISITSEDLSWMASTINILCVCGYVFVGTITDFLGRKRAITIVNLPVIICWIIIYYAQDKTLLLLSRIMLGVCFGGVLMLVYMGIGEYKPPQIRAFSLNLITGVGSLIGITLGHVLSILLHWRYVALIGVIPSALSAIFPFFWIESPTWLATKGRYEEAQRAFRAIHTSSEASDNELRLLIAYEKKKRSELSLKEVRTSLGHKIISAVTQKYFWKIMFFSTVVCIYRVASCRVLFNTLAITMLQDITGTSDILYFTLAVDGFTIFGALLSCFLLRWFKNRSLFFKSGMLANVFLLILGFCLYLYPYNDPYLSWIKVSLIAIYFVITTAGPYPILDTLLSEVFPVEIKSFFSVTMGLVSGIIQFLNIKLVPTMTTVMGYHGIFFLNAAFCFLCLLYLWFYMPETKGRSLHEIEYYFKNNTFNYKNELFTSEQTDDLLNCKVHSKSSTIT